MTANFYSQSSICRADCFLHRIPAAAFVIQRRCSACLPPQGLSAALHLQIPTKYVLDDYDSRRSLLVVCCQIVF